MHLASQHLPYMLLSRQINIIFQENCPGLRSISIEDWEPTAFRGHPRTANVFEAILTVLPPVETICLKLCWDNLDIRTLKSLSSKPELRSLDLALPWDMSLVDSLNASKFLLFPQLQSLKIQAPFELALAFSRHLSSPRSLAVCFLKPMQAERVTERFHDIFEKLEDFHLLESLRIGRDFWPWNRNTSAKITSRQLSQLASCRNLRILRLGRGQGDGYHFASSDADDADIISLTASLPQLIIFEYHVNTTWEYCCGWGYCYRHKWPGTLSLTNKSLEAIGRNCRQLRVLYTCERGWNLRTLCMNSDGSLFPSLEALELDLRGSTTLSEGLSPIIPLLELHFPRLKELSNASGDPNRHIRVKYHRPWQLADVFRVFGPVLVNGHDLRNKPSAREHGSEAEADYGGAFAWQDTVEWGEEELSEWGDVSPSEGDGSSSDEPSGSDREL